MYNVPAEGKPLPTELRREEAKLRHDVELEDDNTAVPRTHIDDEYAHAGERDPKILITTSRDPSTRLVSFAKELKLVFPNAQRINRGGMVKYLMPSAPAPVQAVSSMAFPIHVGSRDAGASKHSSGQFVICVCSCTQHIINCIKLGRK